MKAIAGVVLVFFVLVAFGALLLYCMAAERFGSDGAPDYG